MNLHLELQQKEEQLAVLKRQANEFSDTSDKYRRMSADAQRRVRRLQDKICRIKNPAVGINQVWYSHVNGHKYLMVKTQDWPMELFTLVNLRTGAWWSDPSPDPLKAETHVFKYLGQASEVITTNTES